VRPTGQVIAVDLQPQMLDVLRKRAVQASVTDHLRTHRCQADSLELDGPPLDFALAFYSVHEVPDVVRLMREVHSLLRPGGKWLIVEPIGHVTKAAFQRTLQAAAEAGFALQDRPRIRLSHAALLAKQQEGSSPSLQRPA
jgi:ubiquinone/menaquinone biosynthesis C-methylase UbiE